MSSEYNNDDYTVGWIAAISTEYAAGKAMLDHTHPSLPQQDGDDNSYTYGSIGPHNVVIALLNSYGTVNTAVLSTQMQRSFPKLRFGLMVGVGGGVPSKRHDIRLGDIVVSNPEGQSPGVVQYDKGRYEADGQIHQVGVLDKPPILLLTAMNNLRADEDELPYKITEEVARVFPRGGRRGFRKYPTTEPDILFKADYDHATIGSHCGNCDKTMLVERIEREDTHPEIFYGNIASGNLVMKNARERDRVAERDDILCFEMEAAGLMDHFKCLDIRGICDYSDSHKNKPWQPYAAAIAAAYARTLLLRIPQRAMQQLPDDSARGEGFQAAADKLSQGQSSTSTGNGNQTTIGNSNTSTIRNDVNHGTQINGDNGRVDNRRVGGHSYKNTNISGNAKVSMGDSHGNLYMGDRFG